MITLPPDCVRWIHRNGEDNDCAIAAISLATGLSYETVLGTAMNIQPLATMHGMSMKAIRAALSALGYTSKVRRKFDLDEDTGILWLTGKRDSHVVYLWEGRIVEPSLGRRELWLDPRGYLAAEKFKVGSLLVIEGVETA